VGAGGQARLRTGGTRCADRWQGQHHLGARRGADLPIDPVTACPASAFSHAVEKNFRPAGAMYCKVGSTLRVMPAWLLITRSVMTTMLIPTRIVVCCDDFPCGVGPHLARSTDRFDELKAPSLLKGLSRECAPRSGIRFLAEARRIGDGEPRRKPAEPGAPGGASPSCRRTLRRQRSGGFPTADEPRPPWALGKAPLLDPHFDPWRQLGDAPTGADGSNSGAIQSVKNAG